MTLPTAAVLDHLDRLYLSKTSDHGSAFAAAEYATTLEVAGPGLVAAARLFLAAPDSSRPTAAVLDELERLYRLASETSGTYRFVETSQALLLRLREVMPGLLAASRELLELRAMCFDFEICGKIEGCEELDTEPTRALVRLGLEMWRDAREQCSKVVQADDAARAELATVTEERDRVRELLREIRPHAPKFCSYWVRSEAESPAAALDAMARDAGYADHAAARQSSFVECECLDNLRQRIDAALGTKGATDG